MPRRFFIGTLKMMITFTKYANEKFNILRRHGFPVERASVQQVLELPDAVDDARKPLLFAQRKINTAHTLRVAFKREGAHSRVITFYPIKHE